MKTVPRKDIVDKIVKKLDPDAKPLDSQLFVPAQAAYADSVKNNGSSAYQDVDIDGAKEAPRPEPRRRSASCTTRTTPTVSTPSR